MEYLLPVPDGIQLSAGEWVAGFRRDDFQQCRMRLSQYFEGIGRDSFRVLAELLCSSDGFGVADRDSGYLFGYVGDPRSSQIADRWYLPCRIYSYDHIVARLNEIGYHDKALAEFLTYFGGHRDRLKNSGYFAYISGWRMLTDDIASGFDFNIRGYRDWKDSLMLYHSLDGTEALIRRDGAVGWWVTPELCIRRACDDLEEFVLQYVECRQARDCLSAYYGSD